MMWLKYFICLLLAIQWTTARPTYPLAEEHLDNIFKNIRDIVKDGITLVVRLEKGDGDEESQTRGPPIVGVSKYDIIDLDASQKR